MSLATRYAALSFVLSEEQVRWLEQYIPRIGEKSPLADILDTIAGSVRTSLETRVGEDELAGTGGAALVGIADDGTYFTGDTVEDALQEIGTALPLSFDNGVKATIAVGNATGGATAAALTVDLHRVDGSTVLGGARQILILTGAAQYAPQALNANVTFGTATKGSIIASGSGWCLAETDADGEFDCTASNSTDETVYFWVESPNRVSDATKGCAVLASNSDSAAWSA